ncbi:hypothetical protein N0V88_004776 [Collariella sp. IMI 366227]|nr:hypothetical protein N0V88_004776 [Collariella sp. IMI 366227]
MRWSKNKAVVRSFDESETVKVLVGEEQREFTLHRKLLCNSCAFFRTNIEAISSPSSPGNGDDEDDEDSVLWLPTEAPDMFEIFILWLYQRKRFSLFLERALQTTSPNDRRTVRTNLVLLHLFAAIISLPALQDTAMDALQDIYLRFDWGMSPRFLAFLYRDCDAQHAVRLRRWAVAMLAWTLHGAEKTVAMVGQIDRLFAAYPALEADYRMHTQKMAESRADVRVKNPQLRLPVNKLQSGERFFGFRQCTFHSHRATVGEGMCPHALALGYGVALQLGERRDKEEVEWDAWDADYTIISPVRDLNEVSYLATTAMTSSKFVGELSFGIELEFMFYFKDPKRSRPCSDKQRNIDLAEEKCLAPALTLPDDIVHNAEDEMWAIDEPKESSSRAWAKGLIEEAILSIPGAKLEGKPRPKGTPAKYCSMYITADETDNHSGWTVKKDTSVSDSIDIYGYTGLNFEVTTPALWDRPESHRHVYEVVRELTRRFRLRVNLRTGFHCHVGAGLELDHGEHTPNITANHNYRTQDSEAELRGQKHSLGVLKRAAALMWAADGFLCHAHPPERAINHYAPPLRLYSRLAHGKEICYFHDPTTKTTSIEEVPYPPPPPFTPPVPALPLTSSHLTPSPPPPYAPLPLLPPPHLGRASNPPLRATLMHNLHALQTPPQPTSISVGITHIMRCRNRAQLAQLFAPPKHEALYPRLAYNFRHYLPAVFASRRNTGSHTVEFREATGSR